MTLLLAGSTSGVSGGIVSKVSNGVLCVQNLDHNNMVAKHIKLLDTHFAISCYRHPSSLLGHTGLCRFGWYPLFIAPLVTCAAMLDIYSSTGCDFIRMNIGFVPVNDVWKDSSHMQLGIFSYDSHQDDDNKWKRSFNNGCQSYSAEFESIFIASDQTWSITRILAYISGISSLVALSTAWLLTITPLPASFFWPGVLLPAVVLSMLTGAAKFVFLDATICKEALWFVDGSSSPVSAQSCDIGESSVFCIAAVCS